MFLLVNDLADVLAQYGADLREGAVESASQRSHSCRSSEGNQSQNQEILHQTLARLIFVKAIQGIENQGFHCCRLLCKYSVRFPAPQGSALGTSRTAFTVACRRPNLPDPCLT